MTAITTVHSGQNQQSVSTREAADVRRLGRVRWAVRAVLALGVAASVVANVLHAHPNLVGRAIAAWPPLALLLTIELISRVPVHRTGLAAVRWCATAAISGIAAWVSYWHMVSVCQRYGETATSAHLIPFSVDGLVVVASVCLVELAGRIRTTTDTADSAAPVVLPDPAAVPSPAADRTAGVRPSGARTGTPAGRRTGTRRTARTGGRTGARTDAELIEALAGVPREADGTVPVRRAAAALGTGPDRARRLLAAQGLLRTRPPETALTTAGPAEASTAIAA